MAATQKTKQKAGPVKNGAPTGNKFWQLVQMPTGRPKKYSPVTLWKTALKYFVWVDKHPYQEQKVFSNKHRTKVPKLRAMTERAFCLFAGIDENTFQRYKTHDDYKDFWAVSNAISKLIYTQKFEGAAADFFNPNIIARDLGLIDKKSLDIDYENMTDEQVFRIANILKKSAKK